MTTGRPAKFTTPDELELRWDEYQKDCKDNDKYMSKDGFCLYIGIYRGFYHEYGKKEIFSNILGKIEKVCRNELVERAMKNEYNATIAKLILSANYGLSEKKESLLTVEGGDKPIKHEVSHIEVEDRLKSLEDK